MEHFKGVQFDRTITLYDDNYEAFNLGSLPVIFEVFAKPHGKSLEVFNLGVQTDNEVDLSGEVLDLRPTNYFHECYQMTEDSPSEKILLFYGVSEVI